MPGQFSRATEPIPVKMKIRTLQNFRDEVPSVNDWFNGVIDGLKFFAS